MGPAICGPLGVMITSVACAVRLRVFKILRQLEDVDRVKLEDILHTRTHARTHIHTHTNQLVFFKINRVSFQLSIYCYS